MARKAFPSRALGVPMLEAAWIRHSRLTRIYNEKDFDIDITNYLGETPLIVALISDHHDDEPNTADRAKYVHQLLQAGANPNLKEKSAGKTALIIACQTRQPWSAAIVQDLLNHGADPTLSDNLGTLPLEYAVKAGQPDDILILLGNSMGSWKSTNALPEKSPRVASQNADRKLLAKRQNVSSPRIQRRFGVDNTKDLKLKTGQSPGNSVENAGSSKHLITDKMIKSVGQSLANGCSDSDGAASNMGLERNTTITANVAKPKIKPPLFMIPQIISKFKAGVKEANSQAQKVKLNSHNEENNDKESAPPEQQRFLPQITVAPSSGNTEMRCRNVEEKEDDGPQHLKQERQEMRKEIQPRKLPTLKVNPGAEGCNPNAGKGPLVQPHPPTEPKSSRTRRRPPPAICMTAENKISHGSLPPIKGYMPCLPPIHGDKTE